MASISLIIPTYNRRHLLPQTLRTILGQSLPPAEVIIVDDHSTDGTAAWLQAAYSDQVRVLPNDGRGPGAARNTGLQAATGEYIKFFDSDDLMTRNMLEAQLQELKRSGKRLVYSPYFYATETAQGWEAKDEVILHYRPFSEKRSLASWMLRGLFIPIPGMLFTREILDEVGPWRSDITAYEDWDLLFRLSQLEPAPAHTNACAFLYRLHGEQTTDSHFSHEERDKDRWKVLKYFENTYGEAFNLQERILFDNQFYRILRQYPDNQPFFGQQRKRYAGLTMKLFWQFYRLQQKWGRIRTVTDWQPYHGPLRDREKILQYLELSNES